jgi:hypothetical protein
MEIGNWPASKNLNEIYLRIRKLGLETNLAELEAFGFTRVENALSPERVVKLREAVLREAERRYKTKIDVDNFQDWKLLPYLLYKDPLFADLVLHPKGLALVDYVVGRSAILASIVSHPKGPGGDGRALHADIATYVPSPLARYQVACNCYYFLTDDTKDGGALALVPGSHREARSPTPSESAMSGPNRNANAIPIEAKAGTLVVFVGNMWHGSFPRTIPGLRINLAAVYIRSYVAPLENYKTTVTPKFLERFGGRNSRMAQLVGLNTRWGYGDEGLDPELSRLAENVNRSWHN